MINSFTGKYSFLSNFAPYSIILDALEVKKIAQTSEHGYQAFKAKTEKEFDFVLAAPTPGEAKRRGRQIEIREDWQSVKQNVMYSMLRKKFEYPLLRALLLETGKEELVEGNHWGDIYWGMVNGTGQNWLGKMLMQLRIELRYA